MNRSSAAFAALLLLVQPNASADWLDDVNKGIKERTAEESSQSKVKANAPIEPLNRWQRMAADLADIRGQIASLNQPLGRLQLESDVGMNLDTYREISPRDSTDRRRESLGLIETRLLLEVRAINMEAELKKNAIQVEYCERKPYASDCQ